MACETGGCGSLLMRIEVRGKLGMNVMFGKIRLANNCAPDLLGKAA